MAVIGEDVRGPLTSWTRTLNEEDALMLLEQARPGALWTAWAEAAHDTLPQANRARRNETIRMVTQALLDVEGEGEARTIADSAYLEMMRTGRPQLRLDLLYGRYLYRHPWIELAVAEMVKPAIDASEAPLSDLHADMIEDEAWAAWVDRHIKPGTGPSSVKKTRALVIKHLAALGVLSVEGKRTRVRRAEPARLALGWLVAHELGAEHLGEIAEHRAALGCRGPQMFSATAAYAEQCVAEAVDHGLLRRAHVVGEARVSFVRR